MLDLEPIPDSRTLSKMRSYSQLISAWLEVYFPILVFLIEQETVGNMVGAMPGAWLRPKRDDPETMKRNVLKFQKKWNDYDWTTQISGTDH
jgi:hypothetical protein